MITPRYKTLGKLDPSAEALARHVAIITNNTTLAAERDALRARVDDLLVRLAIVTNERDEARALGRIA